MTTTPGIGGQLAASVARRCIVVVILSLFYLATERQRDSAFLAQQDSVSLRARYIGEGGACEGSEHGPGGRGVNACNHERKRILGNGQRQVWPFPKPERSERARASLRACECAKAPSGALNLRTPPPPRSPPEHVVRVWYVVVCGW